MLGEVPSLSPATPRSPGTPRSPLLLWYRPRREYSTHKSGFLGTAKELQRSTECKNPSLPAAGWMTIPLLTSGYKYLLYLNDQDCAEKNVLNRTLHVLSPGLIKLLLVVQVLLKKYSARVWIVKYSVPSRARSSRTPLC